MLELAKADVPAPYGIKPAVKVVKPVPPLDTVNAVVSDKVPICETAESKVRIVA